MKNNEKPNETIPSTSRRDLLRFASLTSIGAGLSGAVSGQTRQGAAPAASMKGVKFEPHQKVRLGIVGVGGRGGSLLQNFAAVENVEIRALCDIVREKCVRGQAALARYGHNEPCEIYAGNERSFEGLVKRDDLDLVVVSTSWNWHVPIAVSAMKQGKHAAIEVPAARTLEECWEMVNTSEQTRRHCMQLENCCYGYNEMLVWNMVKAGLFGELIHGGAAYLHDLRSILFANNGEGLWRRFEHLNRNGNLYPTHGLGPVAHYMDINRGDRFESIVSMSSLSVSLAFYRETHTPPDDPRRKEKYACGDQNTSLIKTAKGRLIRLEHNVSCPQPYDRINLIAGTKGIFKDYPPVVYIEGRGREQWNPIDTFKQEFAPDLWTRMGEIAQKLGGHGGMDFIMAYRLIQCMKEGTVPDIDVYDTASWSAPGPLSEESIKKGSSAVPFPDFTRGRWNAA